MYNILKMCAFKYKKILVQKLDKLFKKNQKLCFNVCIFLLLLFGDKKDIKYKKI